jgi:hypothetical protein
MDFKVLSHFFFLLSSSSSISSGGQTLCCNIILFEYYSTKSFLSLSSVINEKQREEREPTVGINFATLKFSSSTRPPPPILARDETAFARKAVVLAQIDF